MRSSVAIDFPLNMAVVCHDAGAANIIIASLLKAGSKDVRAYMQGPAEKLWQDAFSDVALCDSLQMALKGADFLLTGTGWASNLEHEARRQAQLMGMRSAAVIDHWVNYAERFVRDGETVWPDEFWVTDDYAMEIAVHTFSGKPVLQVPNYYVEFQLHEIAKVSSPVIPEFLYVLEPMRTDWDRGEAGEFQALDYFLSRLAILDLPDELILVLRPHPSDAPGKYSQRIARHPDMNVRLDTAPGISKALGRASWVAGCHSFALVLAMMAGRKVYCTLPPWAPLCVLPHTGLLHVARMS